MDRFDLIKYTALATAEHVLAILATPEQLVVIGKDDAEELALHHLPKIPAILRHGKLNKLLLLASGSIGSEASVPD